jgi:adenylate cyclase
MSQVSEDVRDAVDEIVNTTWSIRDGRVVPTTEQIALTNGAVRLKAAYLFADLADSSVAAQRLDPRITGKIIRSYLDAASRIIKRFGGEIRSFDGDRVMGIFIGADKDANAVKTALGIHWAVRDVLAPSFQERWSKLSKTYKLEHGVGIASGEVLIVRGGVRRRNDLVSIGPAANVAAKLSGLRGFPSAYITRAVYDELKRSETHTRKGEAMWTQVSNQTIGGKVFEVMGSSWRRAP